MPRTAGMDVDGHAFAGEMPGAAGVIEMDVGHEQPAKVVGRDSEGRELRTESVEGDRASALDEDGATGAVDHERRRGPRDAEVPRVEFGDAEARGRVHRCRLPNWIGRHHGVQSNVSVCAAGPGDVSTARILRSALASPPVEMRVVMRK